MSSNKTPAPAYKTSNLPYYWSPDLWPPDNLACNLNYYLWGLAKAKLNTKSHNTKDALKATILKIMTNIHTIRDNVKHR